MLLQLKPNGFLDLGIRVGQVQAADQLDGSERLLVMAYPSFDPREMLEVEQLHAALVASAAAREQQQRQQPALLTFNGELDRIRTGYYPAFFYPKIGALAKNLLPQFATTYYLKNIKGNAGGAILRCYPGPYQIFARSSGDASGLSLVECREEMPDLRQVALEVLPRAAAKAGKAAQAAAAAARQQQQQ